MPGADGLVAYIVTVHQLSLVIAALLGALAILPYFIAMKRRKAGKVLGGVLLFVGVTLAFHAFFSWNMGVRAFSVEVVQIGGPPEGDKG